MTEKRKGRPPLPKSKLKSAAIVLRLRQSDLRLVRAAARKRKQTVTEFSLAAIFRYTEMARKLTRRA